jgi:hypothetical protein
LFLETVASLLEQVRGMKQSLGRNAADVETGATEAGSPFGSAYELDSAQAAEKPSCEARMAAI